MGAEQVGLVDLFDLGFGQVLAQLGQQVVYAGRPLPPDTIKNGRSDLGHMFTEDAV